MNRAETHAPHEKLNFTNLYNYKKDFFRQNVELPNVTDF